MYDMDPETPIKVLFGGALDLLHMGHILAMEDAKLFGDQLIVNIDSDARVKAKKGSNRPIIPEKDRVAMVASLEIVDRVVCLFGDPDYPVPKLLKMLKPDVLIVSGDSDFVKEQKLCDEMGVKMVKRSRITASSGLDTTAIIAKIRNE